MNEWELCLGFSISSFCHWDISFQHAENWYVKKIQVESVNNVATLRLALKRLETEHATIFSHADSERNMDETDVTGVQGVWKKYLFCLKCIMVVLEAPGGKEYKSI